MIDVLLTARVFSSTRYMPPEVYACFAKHADFRAQMQPPIDVYAFGLILWEILASRTGTTPPDSPNISPGVVVRKRMPFNRTRHRSRAKSLRMHTQVFRRPATQTKVSATTVGFEGVDNAATAGGVDAVGRSESGNDDAFPSSKEVPETTDASTPEAPSPAKNLFELQQVCLRKSFKKDGIPLPIEEVLDVWELPDVCAIRADCPVRIIPSLARVEAGHTMCVINRCLIFRFTLGLSSLVLVRLLYHRLCASVGT